MIREALKFITHRTKPGEESTDQSTVQTLLREAPRFIEHRMEQEKKLTVQSTDCVREGSENQ